MRLKRLKALDVTRSTLKPGMHADGSGLYLRVAKGGSRQWIFRYRKSGRLVGLGLGGKVSISLALARDRAAEARRSLSLGRDLLSEKRVREVMQASAHNLGTSFEQVARDCIEARRAGWRTPSTPLSGSRPSKPTLFR